MRRDRRDGLSLLKLSVETLTLTEGSLETGLASSYLIDQRVDKLARLFVCMRLEERVLVERLDPVSVIIDAVQLHGPEEELSSRRTPFDRETDHPPSVIVVLILLHRGVEDDDPHRTAQPRLRRNGARRRPEGTTRGSTVCIWLTLGRGFRPPKHYLLPMARKQKLKAYRTSICFHDAYVAVPSQKAALEAWGADVDLFTRGVAETVSDEKLTMAPLEKSGTVVRVLRGSGAEHMAALPKDKPARRKSPPASEDEGPPPRRRAKSGTRPALPAAEKKSEPPASENWSPPRNRYRRSARRDRGSTVPSRCSSGRRLNTRRRSPKSKSRRGIFSSAGVTWSSATKPTSRNLRPPPARRGRATAPRWTSGAPRV
jgi:hypothetical protein